MRDERIEMLAKLLPNLSEFDLGRVYEQCIQAELTNKNKK